MTHLKNAKVGKMKLPNNVKCVVKCGWSRDCKRKRMRVLRSNDERLNRQDEMTQNIDEGHLSDSDQKLQEFRINVNNFVHKLCSEYNECFPSIELIKGVCRHCYYDKNVIKKIFCRKQYGSRRHT